MIIITKNNNLSDQLTIRRDCMRRWCATELALSSATFDWIVCIRHNIINNNKAILENEQLILILL